jgi:hypothetical protein
VESVEDSFLTKTVTSSNTTNANLKNMNRHPEEGICRPPRQVPAPCSRAGVDIGGDISVLRSGQRRKTWTNTHAREGLEPAVLAYGQLSIMLYHITELSIGPFVL